MTHDPFRGYDEWKLASPYDAYNAHPDTCNCDSCADQALRCANEECNERIEVPPHHRKGPTGKLLEVFQGYVFDKEDAEFYCKECGKAWCLACESVYKNHNCEEE